MHPRRCVRALACGVRKHEPHSPRSRQLDPCSTLLSFPPLAILKAFGLMQWTDREDVLQLLPDHAERPKCGSCFEHRDSPRVAEHLHPDVFKTSLAASSCDDFS